MERLQKYLARCGVASRRAAEQLILDGQVAVNGALVRELGTRVDPERDRVEVNGRPIRPPTAMVYLALNKPPGVVTTVRDPWGRQTVMSLIPRLGRLYPVGRLDADSEGLLLMTNDGDLANRLTHPRYGCEKEYRALIRGMPDEPDLELLREGIELEDGRTAPAAVERERGGAPPDWSWIRVTLRQGRNRQVRRMLEAIGFEVERLQRVRIGPLQLADLPLGASRPLSRSEVAALRATVGVRP
jgi:23S rRNA pseudouridine2605 synthase